MGGGCLPTCLDLRGFKEYFILYFRIYFIIGAETVPTFFLLAKLFWELFIVVGKIHKNLKYTVIENISWKYNRQIFFF